MTEQKTGIYKPRAGVKPITELKNDIEGEPIGWAYMGQSREGESMYMAAKLSGHKPLLLVQEEDIHFLNDDG